MKMIIGRPESLAAAHPDSKLLCHTGVDVETNSVALGVLTEGERASGMSACELDVPKRLATRFPAKNMLKSA
ncbi:hypothetical protein [Rhodopirellula halodulae]|uniref:hypothetical protein n=1 Tax=Rhodopirellula halodulae TaxID=2894198 RepID=UPI001E3A383F|nr:hypothetical protein [Rhodopirellula sp. JC737]MCC9658580.1 hypothetical protein [Rhodopirellula sp. JC737]